MIRRAERRLPSGDRPTKNDLVLGLTPGERRSAGAFRGERGTCRRPHLNCDVAATKRAIHRGCRHDRAGNGDGDFAAARVSSAFIGGCRCLGRSASRPSALRPCLIGQFLQPFAATRLRPTAARRHVDPAACLDVRCRGVAPRGDGGAFHAPWRRRCPVAGVQPR